MEQNREPRNTPQLYGQLFFDKAGKIFGAQIVGQDGVDKRIDVIATAMRLGATTHDLKELELAYAPPYSSAKDPVNMLGFVASNILEKLVSFKSPQEADEALKSGKLVILDVTEDMERQMWMIDGSLHIPLGEIRQRLSELPKEVEICTYCAIGVRSYNAARILRQHGFKNVSVLESGIGFYKSFHFVPKQSGDLPRQF